MNPKIYYPPDMRVLNWLKTFCTHSDSILDVGSGDGRYSDIPHAIRETLDIWPASYPTYLRDLEIEDLPNNYYSVVLLLDVLEHLNRERSMEILEQAKEIATRAVVVLTPIIWDENKSAFEEVGGFYEHNERIMHRSLWTLNDFDSSWKRVHILSDKKYFVGYRLTEGVNAV